MTQPELLPDTAADFIGLLRQAGAARDEAALARVLSDTLALVDRLQEEDIAYLYRAQLATAVYDRITARAIQLTIQQNPQLERGTFMAWISLGSAGRQEQLRPNDQDHALVYQKSSGSDDAPVRMLRLAGEVVDLLDRVGIARCTGNLMASNPVLNQSSSGWRCSLREWASSPGPHTTRMFSILLDMRPIYGELRLAENLRKAVRHRLARTPSLMSELIQDSLRIPLARIPLPSRRVVPFKEPDRIDLKAGAVQPLIAGVRALACLEDVDATSTRARVELLLQRGVLPDEDGIRLLEAYGILKDFANSVRPEDLSAEEKILLHRQIEVIEAFRDLLARRAAERLGG